MRLLSTASLLCAALVTSAIAGAVYGQQPGAQPPPYRVIVHPHNPTISAERSFVEDAFLKKVTRWASGKVIHPVDLRHDSTVRSRFSKDVLGRSVAAVKAYWQQRIFSGVDVPPPELDGDAEVIAHVLRHEGAIGYVSGAADVSRVKTLHVRR